jgi:RNA 3'-terminal phosphate cyclase (ATP)
MIEIDGAQGEGGGQILRTSLSMSVLTGKGVHVRDIRGRRPKPGLMPQHLKAVEASASISHGRVQGAVLGSTSLYFEPGAVTGGNYQFDVGSAGAATLVLQTIAVPLSFGTIQSCVTIIGGTHVPWSPSYHYLAWHWLHYLGRSGYRIASELVRPGFYPRGGGCLTAHIQPIDKPTPLVLSQRGALKRVRGMSLAASLGRPIALRQQRQAQKRLTKHCSDIDIAVLRLSSYSPGTALVLIAEFETSQCCYAALGARGKPAERVADDAVDALEAFLATPGAINEHLADQLVVPLSVVPGTSRLRTARITPHLLTNAGVVREFLPVDIEITGEVGAPGEIRIEGVGR